MHYLLAHLWSNLREWTEQVNPEFTIAMITQSNLQHTTKMSHF